MSLRTLRATPISRLAMSRGGAARGAVSFRAQAAEQRWLESADAVTVFLTEVRAHGNVEEACRQSRITRSSISHWRYKRADFDNEIRLAQRFARSDAVSYTDWLKTEVV